MVGLNFGIGGRDLHDVWRDPLVVPPRDSPPLYNIPIRPSDLKSKGGRAIGLGG